MGLWERSKDLGLPWDQALVAWLHAMLVGSRDLCLHLLSVCPPRSGGILKISRAPFLLVMDLDSQQRTHFMWIGAVPKATIRLFQTRLSSKAFSLLAGAQTFLTTSNQEECTMKNLGDQG